uniref:Lipoprotein n=1 Tax=Geobacter sp. (strain M21) TaxID=443144 RepID=C6E3J0_GEOSM
MKSKRFMAAAGMSLGVVAAFQAGCAGPAKVAQPATQTQPEQKAPDYETQILSGKVAETMAAGGYTYLNLEKDGKKSWAAVAGTPNIAVGREVTLKPGMVMKNFTSKSLNQKFDQIVFSEGFAAGAPVSAINMEKVGGKVKETMTSGGYTYASLEKDGKTVWVALPATELKVGQDLEIENAMPMKSFNSKSLNRTFDVIYFGSSIKGGSGPVSATPPGHPVIGVPKK